MQKKEVFLKKLFTEFHKKNINFIILRGQEFIKNKDKLGELDILIKKSDLKKLKRTVKKIKYARQLKNNIDLTHPFLVRFVRDDFVVDFDFQIEGIGYCGSPILKEKFLFKNIIKKNNLIYLNSEAEFLMLMIHGFIFKKKGVYFKKYQNKFLELYKKSKKDRINKKIEQLFGKNLSKKIYLCLERGDLKSLFKIRKKLITKHIFNNPFRVFPILISKAMRFRNYFNLNEFFYFINPFKWGPLISFVGSDGSGKTTLVKISKKHLNRYMIPSKIIFAGVFSPIKNPFNKKRKEKTYSEKVGSLKNKHSFIEILIRILFQIPKQIKLFYYRKRGYFVLTDRYIYDLITLYGVKGIFKKIIKNFFQKPTKIFYISAPSKIIHERNQELNLISIKKVINSFKQNKKYLSLIELKNQNKINSSSDLKNHLDQIIKNV
ncbi:hypothetical protein ISS08_01310 [Candidatus Pacearchaeota archaeon]|nr:hypothetical protein [Candidatus Pacearchaeota archaeon]